MRTGAQRAVGWCETVERSHGTRLGASVRTPEYLESRRRRYPPLYGEDIRIMQNIPYPMKPFINKSGTTKVTVFRLLQ